MFSNKIQKLHRLYCFPISIDSCKRLGRNLLSVCAAFESRMSKVALCFCEFFSIRILFDRYISSQCYCSRAYVKFNWLFAASFVNRFLLLNNI